MVGTKIYPKFSARGRCERDRKRYNELEDIYDRCPDECPYCHSKSIRRYGFTGEDTSKKNAIGPSQDPMERYITEEDLTRGK